MLGDTQAVAFEITEQMKAALVAAEGVGSSAKGITRLSQEFGDEAARWAVMQWELRRKGAEKFSGAESLFFTRAGFEMASHEEVAAYHASLFPRNVEIWDLTCGIGADLRAFAARGPGVGVDLDPEHVVYARLNSGCDVIRGDGVVQGEGKRYVFADPQRRKGDRRVGPGDFSPSVADLVPLMEAAEVGLMKLSPMLSDEFLLGLGGDVEFVSFGGECREALVRWPGLASVSAVRVETGSHLERYELEGFADEPSKFFYEADPAVIRAHGLGNFGLAGLGDSNGYLTGDDWVESEWLTGYRVVWRGAWRVKGVREVLAENGWKVVAVKKRGVDVEPVKAMKTFKGLVGEGVIVALYPVGAKVCVAILKKI